MIDLAMFCAKEDGLFRVSLPWIADGYEVATTGAWVARRPSTEPDTVFIGLRAPDYRKVFDGLAHEDAKEELPPLNGTTRTEPCPRAYPGNCSNCNGTGQCSCPHCDEDHTCGDCDGEGKTDWGGEHPEECECTGSGNFKVPGYQKIGAAKFDGRMIEKLLALPGIKITPPVEAEGKLYFTADDELEGLVASIRG